jgi:DNA processing protein
VFTRYINTTKLQMLSIELPSQIALTLINGVGDILAKNLVAYCGSAEEVFKTGKSKLEKIPGIGSYVASAIQKNKEAFEKAESEIAFIEKNKISPLFFTDANYPNRLKHCSDSPILLFYKGTANLNAEKIVSVVGTRTPSLDGKILTEKLVTDLQKTGCLIVSGMAYGIDVEAHKSALHCGLETIGVMAHGLDRVYPSSHSNYAKEMITQGGLLTEFLSETNPDRENFPKRNRIVAGMCDAIVVVESKKDGGSLITTTIANSYNKDVFAFPGKPGDPLSEGCNGLIKLNKASLIENADDLIYHMNWNLNLKQKPSSQIPLSISLSEEEQQIMNAFKEKQSLHIDEICYATNFTVSQTSSYLLQLEFSNIIKSLPGKMYRLNR